MSIRERRTSQLNSEQNEELQNECIELNVSRIEGRWHVYLTYSYYCKQAEVNQKWLVKAKGTIYVKC